MAFDYIVVGAGNGACGFLSCYLDSESEGKVLVLEEGENFFYSSDIAHLAMIYFDVRVIELHQDIHPMLV